MRLFVFAILATSLIGCTGYESKKFESDGSQSLSSQNQGQSTNQNPNAPLGTLTASVNAAMSLGEIQTFNAVYQVDDEYSGPVRFTVDRTPLMGIEGQQDISITVDPGILNVTPGQRVDLEIEVNTPFRSPSFDIQQLKIVAYDDNDKMIEAPMSLSVASVINIELRECDYQNNALLDQCWSIPESIDLRAHAQDVELRFTNCDASRDHVVHGNGPIDHQPVNNPMDPAVSATECTGSYVATIAGDFTGDGTYYMHNTQANAQRRTINFGMVSPASAAVASSADKFDRGASNTGETCHDPVGVP